MTNMATSRTRCPRCHHYPGTAHPTCICYCHPTGRERVLLELDDLHPRRIDAKTTARMKANMRRFKVGGWT